MYQSKRKALLHVQYEAGTRPGELLSLSIKHVKSDKYGMVITVDGKTGARPIRLIESVPNLSKWLTSHPMKDNPDTPLWINFTKNRYGMRLSHASATKVLYQACRKAGINKKVNLKLFRHSEATRTASFMPESVLRKRHGWSLSSRMPAKYAHITQQDVENSILGHYGIVQDDKQVKRVPKICPICKNHNSFDAKTCDNCSKPLDLEKAILLEEESKKEKENIENRMRVLEDEINESKIKEGATKDLIIQLMNDDNFKSMLEDAAKKLDKRKPFVKE